MRAGSEMARCLRTWSHRSGIKNNAPAPLRVRATAPLARFLITSAPRASIMEFFSHPS
jgi:hypothetical protein